MSRLKWSTYYMETNARGQILVATETDVAWHADSVGAIRAFSENDAGILTGTPDLFSPETDIDYRQRVAQDLQLDEEIFNYTAQNTGKHMYLNTTMTNAWQAGQMVTNSGNITTTTTGTSFQTRNMFPTTGTSTLSADVEIGFSNQPQSNTIIDFGFINMSGTNPYTPVDGVYIRLNSAGFNGIANHNGIETSTWVFTLADGITPWSYDNNKKYQFIIYSWAVKAVFWVNDWTWAVKLGEIPLPAGQARMIMSTSIPFGIRHAITGGAAGSAMSALLGAYNIRLGGVNYATSPATAGNRMYGSYEWRSGGTMGSLANYANSTNPTAAVPTNTTAALGTGLGGQFWETDTLAVNTDGIICSYQVPSSINWNTKRLVIRWINIDTFVQTALTGGGYNEIWTLAFGATWVSLAIAEAASTKARRIVPIGNRAVAAAAPALTQLPRVSIDLWDAPVFVNPGEFVNIAKKKVGTAPTAWVMAHLITFIYGWE